MNRFVLDCSVTMSWCFSDEPHDQATAVLQRLNRDEAIVPPIWALEVVNVLLVAERRGRLTVADSHEFLALLESLPILVLDSTKSSLTDILELSRTYELSSYDAAYLRLAIEHNCPLCSFDNRLRHAASGAGVHILH